MIKKITFEKLLRLLKYPFAKLNYKEFHLSDRVMHPDLVTPRCIKMGEDVFIRAHCRIEGVTRYNDKEFSPCIIIRNGVSIEQNLHLTCAGKISIGNDTAIAANVSITDITHPYIDISRSIEKQDIEVSFVEIGPECKIYNNVVILPGVTIGRHCVLGANSVVNKDIPDYSVAVGVPAKVVKRYDFETKTWVKVD
jgi:acetyltransferase-like isoleucine patch superfamily enzyme